MVYELGQIIEVKLTEAVEETRSPHRQAGGGSGAGSGAGRSCQRSRGGADRRGIRRNKPAASFVPEKARFPRAFS